MENLLEHVDKTQCECLNITPNSAAVIAVLENKEAAPETSLESDSDEQLLLTVAFTSLVKLQSMVIRGNPEDASRAPKLIKLFCNAGPIDFDQASSAEPTQEIELTEEQVKDGAVIPLKWVKFQKVSTIAIFVESNQEDEDSTQICSLEFTGKTLHATKMNDFKRVAGEAGEGE